MRRIHGHRSAKRHVRGPRRSHAASDPGSSFRGRGVGHRAGQAVRPEPSRHLETLESAAAGRVGQAEPEGAVAAMPPGWGPAERGSRLGGGVPAVLGREFRATRRIPGDRTKGGKRMTAKAGTPTAKTDYVIEPGKQEIIITRDFDAPRELVFKAFTDPKLVSQWFGPREYSTTVDKMEARPGGLWRFVQQNEKGDEFAFHRVHHHVVAPGRVIATFEFEGVPGPGLLQTGNFQTLGQKTRLA